MLKNRHIKLSVELLEVSVGHNSPGLHQFYCKICFCKILNFVKKMSQTLLAIATFTLKSSNSFNLPKITHLKLSDELMWASAGLFSPDLHQF